MDFQKILADDIARYEQNQHPSFSEPFKDERAKTKIDFRRCIQLGEILVKHFPDLQCFYPQLNAAANDVEFKPFEDFITKIFKYKPVRDAWKKMLEERGIEREVDQS